MKLGTENKSKVLVLAAVVVIGGVVLYTQLAGGSDTPVRVRPVQPDGAAVADQPKENAAPDISRASQQTSRPRGAGKNGEFHPVLVSKKKEERVDLANQDPSLRLDLLAKVMNIPAAGGARDLFTLTRTPPVAAVLPGKEPKIVLAYFQGPRQPPPPAPPPTQPPPPPPPPITLRYFGTITEVASGKRVAYFLDGDEPLEGREGEVLKGGRYKVLQIGPDKVLIEDKQSNRRQSIDRDPEASQ